ncbi:MAG: ribonuclease HII [Alphaproteobacteria bacterium PRO2]|nr:ribonuclease HII [Alphaproteobacteria bacterium PRO2]
MSSKSPEKVSKGKRGPDFSIERSAGGLVCGLDEVGRAPLAGAVVAACVFIPEEHLKKKIWMKVNDSKALTRGVREELVVEIREYSSWAIGEACPREIETINIVQASFLAMRRAFDGMCGQFGVQPDMALIDGHIRPKFPCAVQAVVKGDARSVSIAAASIIAKVHRDRMLTEMAMTHPHYGWERNVGYPTTEHLEAIDRHGITDHHRKTFAPVRNFIEFGSVHRQLSLAV